MRFPLAQRILTRGAAAHVAAGLGIGCDYRAVYVDYFAPFDGTTFHFNEGGGGTWLRITSDDGYRVEVAHLSERLVPSGVRVREGQRVAVTGETGTIIDAPHAHLQVFHPNGNRIDPEVFFANLSPNPPQMALEKIVKAQKEKLAAIENGLIASAFDPATKKTYLVKDGKKRELPPIEVLNALLVPGITTDILNQIPNA